ncbi:PolC-type DNA polymerase III [Salipaludibacillus sp. HK11]|uniref:3'-5' exonuclease n=1 Tax=Salipaludibacillus sp. HK11 TaxID=3394320 RepID=UPI0039FD395D
MMKVSVMQIIIYFFYHLPRFLAHKKTWLKQNHGQYELITKELSKEIIREPTIDIFNLPMTEVNFTVFDLETTGLFPKIGDEVLSIGAMKINIHHIQFPESFYEIICPVKQPSFEVRDLTGLTLATINSGKSFPTGFLQFYEFAKGTVIAAHPASFDVTFLKKMALRWELPSFEPVVIDTYEMAQLIFPNSKNSLDELVNRFDIEEKERHHALNDAFMTSEVLKYLIDELIKRNIFTLNQFFQVKNAKDLAEYSR